MRKYFILFCQFCSHLLFLIFIKNIKCRYKNLRQIFLTDQSLIEKYIKCCMENKFFSFTNYHFLAATVATYSHSKNICMPKLSFSTSLLKTFPCCSLAKLFFYKLFSLSRTIGQSIRVPISSCWKKYTDVKVLKYNFGKFRVVVGNSHWNI
jgi:hypothetical protein